MKSQLLPEGFRDSLPDWAVKEEKINSFFINLMKKNGYLLVRPPLLEFESSLFFLLEDNNDKNSFRVLDPISQKMMGYKIRYYITDCKDSMWFFSKLPKTTEVVLFRGNFESK